MKINWKVRLRNPVFWATAIPAFITFIYSLLSALEITPKIEQETILKVFATICSMLSIFGVVTDPTTQGMSDSERAMSYLFPWKRNKKD